MQALLPPFSEEDPGRSQVEGRISATQACCSKAGQGCNGGALCSNSLGPIPTISAQFKIDDTLQGILSSMMMENKALKALLGTSEHE